MAIELFTKGHNALVLRQALAIKDPTERFKAVSEVPIYGTRKIVDPLCGLNAQPSGAEIEPPHHIRSSRRAEELIEVAGAVLAADEELEGREPGKGIPESEIGKILFDVLMKMGGTTIVADSSGAKRPGGLFRMNSARLGARKTPLLDNGYPSEWGQRLSFDSNLRLGFYNGTEAAYTANQRGLVTEQQVIGPLSKMTTLRAVASLVHRDPPTSIPVSIARELLFIKASPSARFPLLRSIAGFVDYLGAEQIEYCINAACHSAMLECFRLKRVYGSPRPEESWPDGIKGELHPNFLLYGGPIIERMGGYLKTLVAEGCPIHDDFPSGHAVIAGAGFTILKASFANQVFTSGGIEYTSLHRHLDLVAWYMGLGREAMGIHTRSSLIQGLMLGQWHAIQFLNHQTSISPMPLGATTFLGFDGKMIYLAGS